MEGRGIEEDEGDDEEGAGEDEESRGERESDVH